MVQLQLKDVLIKCRATNIKLTYFRLLFQCIDDDERICNSIRNEEKIMLCTFKCCSRTIVLTNRWVTKQIQLINIDKVQ